MNTFIVQIADIYQITVTADTIEKAIQDAVAKNDAGEVVKTSETLVNSQYNAVKHNETTA